MSPPCREQDLDALLAEELSPAEAERVRTHAEGCASCAHSLSWMKLERGWMTQRARRMPSRPALNFEALQARLATAPARPAPPERRPAPGRTWSWSSPGKMALGVAAAVAFLAVNLTRMPPASSIEESWTQEALASGMLACEDTSSQEVAAMEARFGACLIASPVLSSH
ncbi:zf-HC2 domain-containing protein [Stigmatella sp. ncwal1]|uniref:Zf-HC2 domain-containing protein n=1 Tax=Stigmatella ashevillensis TaxID=2995309 RepID=A0ABT5DGQ5_9BACT|nr:zf-HC2 domain-containing protein [Stigmatella ashevillena]MDC0712310.1 zf-HC2 domain-containing protein [Stigmatella ashevillena]